MGWARAGACLLLPTPQAAVKTGKSVCVCVLLQVDQEPSIRANTTVLLGNIAQYLGDQYCKKVGPG